MGVFTSIGKKSVEGIERKEDEHVRRPKILTEDEAMKEAMKYIAKLEAEMLRERWNQINMGW